MQGGLLASQRPGGRLHGELTLRSRLSGPPSPEPGVLAAGLPLLPASGCQGEDQLGGGGGRGQETLLRWLGVTAQHLRVRGCPGSPSYAPSSTRLPHRFIF